MHNASDIEREPPLDELRFTKTKTRLRVRTTGRIIDKVDLNVLTFENFKKCILPFFTSRIGLVSQTPGQAYFWSKEHFQKGFSIKYDTVFLV